MPNLETWSSADGDGVVATLDTLGNMAVASLSVAGTPVVSGGMAPSATVYTSAHTAVSGEYARVDASAGNIPVTLPSAPANNTTIGVTQIAVSGSYTTTITCGTGDALNKTGGSTSYTLTLANQGAIFQYNTAGAYWMVTADNLPLGSLDTRYLNVTHNLSDLPSVSTAQVNIGLGSTPAQGASAFAYEAKTFPVDNYGADRQVQRTLPLLSTPA